MSLKSEVVVVGAGIAGLTCACYLAKSGLKTLLIEKESKTGGLVNTFWHDGFAFDGGARAFENSGILFPMLHGLGIDLEFVKNPVSIGIDERWVTLASHDSLQEYASLLSETFPDNAADVALIAEDIRKIMGYLDVIYGIDNPLFLEDMHDPKYLKDSLLPWLVKYQKNIRHIKRLREPVYAHLKRLTSNQALIDMIAQHFFQNTPSFFAMSYFGLYLDYSYPMGGTGMLTQRLTDYFQEAGGTLLTNAAAHQIDPDKHELILSDGQNLGYQQLVWAADQQALYQALPSLVPAKVSKQRTLTASSSGADSIFSLFLGVDLDRIIVAERMGAHAFFTPEITGLSSLPDWRSVAQSGMESLYGWVDSYLERTTYELSCPAERDLSLAPDGKTGIIISTLMDYELVKFMADAGEYEAFKQICSDKIIAILDATLLDGLKEKTLFSVCATPLTIEEKAGTLQGAITGWAFTNPIMPSESRFDKITKSVKTPIPDVVQCGQWSFSPSGVPTCVLTGKLAADAVIKKLKI